MSSVLAKIMPNRRNLYTCKKKLIDHYIYYTIRGKVEQGKRKKELSKKLLSNQNPKSNSENFPDAYMISLFRSLVKSFFLLSSEPEQEQKNTLVYHHTSRAGAAHFRSSFQK